MHSPTDKIFASHNRTYSVSDEPKNDYVDPNARVYKNNIVPSPRTSKAALEFNDFPLCLVHKIRAAIDEMITYQNFLVDQVYVHNNEMTSCRSSYPCGTLRIEYYVTPDSIQCASKLLLMAYPDSRESPSE